VNLEDKDLINIRVWLIEYKVMLEREAKSSLIPFMAKKKRDKANKIDNFIDKLK
jgi:hypothetical protein